jgi:hypothetical protein
MRRAPVAHKRMCCVRDEPHDIDFCLTFRDSFLGKCEVSLALDAAGNPLPPPEQRAQIIHPLHILKAAEWFFENGRVTSRKRHQKISPVLLDHMLVQFSPCVPVRVMVGFVATSCRRLATAPAGVHVNCRTTRRWSERIFERVTWGRMRRVQVMAYPAAARLLSRAGVLTRTSANVG